jgi:hypothetical protein
MSICLGMTAQLCRSVTQLFRRFNDVRLRDAVFVKALHILDASDHKSSQRLFRVYHAPWDDMKCDRIPFHLSSGFL